jgi:hypothetical protein
METLVLIFSKDRAAQLDLLLRSMTKHDNGGIWNHIMVLYKSSNDEFERGYKKIYHNINTGGIYPTTMCWDENDPDALPFKEELLCIINTTEPKYIMFLVDDMIMMNDVTFNWVRAKQMLETQPISTISLRLGLNTTWQYQTNSPTMMPLNYKEENNLIIWNRVTIPPTMNFNYPLSTDGHIFRADMIVPIIREMNFTFPNDFEAGLQAYARRVPALMACPKQSVFVNSPINLVQDKFKNKAGTKYGIPSKELNDKFLAGQRINYESIDFNTVKGCHQELLMEFE